VVISNPSNTVAEVNQYETFTATITNGTAPFAYTFLVVNAVNKEVITHAVMHTSVVQRTDNFTFRLVTSDVASSPFIVNVTVVDAKGAAASSAYSDNFTVNQALSLSGGLAYPIINTSQTQMLESIVSGGTTPYTYNFLVYNSTGSLVTSALFENPLPSNCFTFTQNPAWGLGMFTATLVASDSASSQTILSGSLYYTVQASTSTTTSTSTSTTATSTASTTLASTSVSTTSTQTTTALLSGTGDSGASGGGSFLPTITLYANGNQTGYEITNFSQTKFVSVSIGDKTFTVVLNFITPTSVGVTINGQSFTLSPNTPIKLGDLNSFAYYTELTEISYVPILQTITMRVYAQPTGPFQYATTSISTTTIETTVPATTVETTVPLNTTTLPTTTVLASNATQASSGPAAGSFTPSVGTAGVAVTIAIAVGIASPKLRATKRQRK